MLFRVAGKFVDGKSFSTRIESISALAAATAVVAGIKTAGGDPDKVTELRTVPMGAKVGQAVHIGEARAPRAPRKPATKPATPAATPARR